MRRRNTSRTCGVRSATGATFTSSAEEVESDKLVATPSLTRRSLSQHNPRTMRPTTLLFTTLFATASLAVAQTPSAAPKAPTTTSPAAATTTTTASSPATTTSTTTSTAPSADEMKQMMELAKLNDNHKLLAS